jgi:hypothetical protein
MLLLVPWLNGARSSAVGWGATITSQNVQPHCGAGVDLASNRKWVPGIFLRGKRRPVRKADKLTAICEPIFKRKCGSLDISQPYGPPRPVTGIALYTGTGRKWKYSPTVRQVRKPLTVLGVRRRLLSDVLLTASAIWRQYWSKVNLGVLSRGI